MCGYFENITQKIRDSQIFWSQFSTGSTHYPTTDTTTMSTTESTYLSTNESTGYSTKESTSGSTTGSMVQSTTDSTDSAATSNVHSTTEEISWSVTDSTAQTPPNEGDTPFCLGLSCQQRVPAAAGKTDKLDAKFYYTSVYEFLFYSIYFLTLVLFTKSI